MPKSTAPPNLHERPGTGAFRPRDGKIAGGAIFHLQAIGLVLSERFAMDETAESQEERTMPIPAIRIWPDLDQHTSGHYTPLQRHCTPPNHKTSQPHGRTMPFFDGQPLTGGLNQSLVGHPSQP